MGGGETRKRRAKNLGSIGGSDRGNSKNPSKKVPTLKTFYQKRAVLGKGEGGN